MSARAAAAVDSADAKRRLWHNSLFASCNAVYQMMRNEHGKYVGAIKSRMVEPSHSETQTRGGDHSGLLCLV